MGILLNYILLWYSIDEVPYAKEAEWTQKEHRTRKIESEKNTKSVGGGGGWWYKMRIGISNGNCKRTIDERMKYIRQYIHTYIMCAEKWRAMEWEFGVFGEREKNQMKTDMNTENGSDIDDRRKKKWGTHTHTYKQSHTRWKKN